MSSLGARLRKDREPLTKQRVAKILSTVLPRRNGYTAPDAESLLAEFHAFGIRNPKELRLLLKRHRRRLMEIDATPLDQWHERQYRRDLGHEAVSNAIRYKRWFSHEALAGIALELEFGERYRVFADNRDEI
jgi:hypothetical protein